MKLIEIDKTTYRKRLNKIIAAFVIGFALLAVALGAILIALFGDAAVNGEQVNNFRFNLLGVILALIVAATILSKLKGHSVFTEVYYVWQLKQIHNSIYRKLKKIKQAGEQGNINAFIILNFYYLTLKQVYTLDDNTLTIASVEKNLSDLQAKMAEHNVTITTEQFEKSLVKSF